MTHDPQPTRTSVSASTEVRDEPAGLREAVEGLIQKWRASAAQLRTVVIGSAQTRADALEAAAVQLESALLAERGRGQEGKDDSLAEARVVRDCPRHWNGRTVTDDRGQVFCGEVQGGRACGIRLDVPDPPTPATEGEPHKESPAAPSTCPSCGSKDPTRCEYLGHSHGPDDVPFAQSGNYCCPDPWHSQAEGGSGG